MSNENGSEQIANTLEETLWRPHRFKKENCVNKRLNQFCVQRIWNAWICCWPLPAGAADVDPIHQCLASRREMLCFVSHRERVYRRSQRCWTLRTWPTSNWLLQWCLHILAFTAKRAHYCRCIEFALLSIRHYRPTNNCLFSTRFLFSMENCAEVSGAFITSGWIWIHSDAALFIQPTMNRNGANFVSYVNADVITKM